MTEKKELKQRIKDLEDERDYLDKRLAQFERVSREFVNYHYPDHIMKMKFYTLLHEEE